MVNGCTINVGRHVRVRSCTTWGCNSMVYILSIASTNEKYTVQEWRLFRFGFDPGSDCLASGGLRSTRLQIKFAACWFQTNRSSIHDTGSSTIGSLVFSKAGRKARVPSQGTSKSLATSMDYVPFVIVLIWKCRPCLPSDVEVFDKSECISSAMSVPDDYWTLGSPFLPSSRFPFQLI